MEMRHIGSSKIEVARICLGGNVFGWTADESTSFRILDAFVDRGFNFIDTADMYSSWVPGHTGGESETIIGKWLKQSGKRSKVVIATKLGQKMPGGEGLGKAWIAQATEDSLRRLQTDYIDLYQSHKDDESVPFEETFSAYRQLVETGKVRAIGASNYRGERLTVAMYVARSHSYPVYQSLQPNYNLHEREHYETTLEPVVEKFQLSVIPYFSLASGFLTGKYKTKEDAKGASREAMVGKYFDARGEKILKALDEIAAHYDLPQASVALAWLLKRHSITAPIASATKVEHLDAMSKAVELKLCHDDIVKLNLASEY